MVRKILYLQIFLIIVLQTHAQDHSLLDSLVNKLEQSGTDKQKHFKADSTTVSLLLEIGYQLEYYAPDSAAFYYKEALKIAEEIHSLQLMAKSANWLGIVYHNLADYGLALDYYKKSLKVNQQLTISEDSILVVEGMEGMARCQNNIGLINDRLGNFKIAVENYQNSLRTREQMLENGIGDVVKLKAGIANCYNNIGIVYDSDQEYERAIEYHEKSLALREEIGDKSKIATSLNNLGVVYHEQAGISTDPILAMPRFEFARKYYNKALEIFQSFMDSQDESMLMKGNTGTSNCLNNIAMVYQEQAAYMPSPEMELAYLDTSLLYNFKSLEIKTQMGDKAGTGSSFGNIAAVHGSMAAVVEDPAMKKQLHEKSLEYAKKSLEIAIEIQSVPLQHHAYKFLYMANKGLNRFNDALYFHEKYFEADKSMFNLEKKRAIEEMEARYQTEKGLLKIEKLETESTLQNVLINKQRLVMNGLAVGIGLILITLLLLIRLFYLKRKANKLLAERNFEISQKNEEITAQRDEIEAQRDNIIEHRDTILAQMEEIEDSIQYASRIQNAIFASYINLADFFAGNFIIFKPKDIVSGDFYWVTKINSRIFIAVADCTGHGVPGAFMSILGVSFLNETVRKNTINNPAEIIDSLRKSIIDALKQSGNQTKNPVPGEVKDGLDISLLVIDEDKNRAVWSGANMPLWIIRNQEPSGNEDDKNLIEELVADKMPVAIHPKMHEFTNHDIEVFKGDKFYLFSDGFSDQFGGPEGKKFLTKRLRNLVSQTSALSMEDQGVTIENELDKWMNWQKESHIQHYDQIDDITVIGLQI